MIFSNNAAKSLLGVFLSAGLLISCSDNNTPQVKGENNSTFYVDSLTAKFATVGEPNAQGKQSKKLISFEACLKDNAQTNSVSNLKFDVVAGEAAATKVSDYRGCLVWYELMDFDPNAEIKNIFMSRDVKALESHSGSEKLVFWVNPYKDTFEFNRHGSTGAAVQSGPVTYMLSRDVKTNSIAGYEYDIYVKISEDVNNMLSPIRRQAELTSLRLDFRNIDYWNVELDANLNLTFPYTYKTSLAMDLIRQDLGNITSEKIKRGNFMFNLVFLKEAAKVDKPGVGDVVAAVKWTAKPRGDAGLIEVPISVKFSNIAAMTSRMNVLLTITSLDTPALFADQSYDGVVNSVTANGNLDISLIQNENSARDLLEKYEADKAQKPVRVLTAKQVIEADGFKMMSSPAVKFTYRKGLFSKPVPTKVDLATVIENLQASQSLSDVEEKAVCAAFFLDTQGTERAYKDCLDSPNGVLKAEVREFVSSMNTKPVDITFLPKEELTITAKFDLSEQKVKRSGYGLEGNIGGSLDGGLSAKAGICSSPFGCGGPLEPGKGGRGAGANIGIGATFGISGKAYTAQSLDKVQVDGKNVTVEKTQLMSAQPIVITLNMKTVKCLLVVANDDYKKGTKAVNMPSSKYFCNKAGVQQDRNEYFFLLDHVNVAGNSAVADQYSSVVNPLRMLVRGQKPYDLLKGILTSDKFAYKWYLGSINADQVTDDPTNFMTQEAPLVLSSTRKIVLGK